jgi:hypothetical protein
MNSIEEIIENYKNYSDQKIEYIAKNPTGLRKEIVPFLVEEIKRRKLNIELIDWVNYESNTFEGLERDNIINLIKYNTCSICQIEKDLFGFKFNTIISAIILIEDKTEFKIICNECATPIRIKTMITTLLLGWWSKQGFLSTPFTVISDLYKMLTKESQSDEIIESFIDKNTGNLRMVLDKKKIMKNLLASFNKKKNQLDV